MIVRAIEVSDAASNVEFRRNAPCHGSSFFFYEDRESYSSQQSKQPDPCETATAHSLLTLLEDWVKHPAASPSEARSVRTPCNADENGHADVSITGCC